ncbi:MAG TPA: uridine diphosphate-N-acetylglucosamine-binding protein YvcK [Dermatophilaceae bacterium]|nr:uridine diphosphate-N-acetylglucosamine-binding protein YvcK [Dermatophilaceae bacterium]
MTRPAVVALGGGHGLAASLTALRLVTDRITAVVTVADDGGSSGRLRDEFNVLPPGDLRMALAALCDDTEWGHQWSDVLQHRFDGDGQLAGHAVGNLLIVSLWDLLGDPVRGLDLVGRLLNARGRVLPMAAVPLNIEASVMGADPTRPLEITTVRGQVEVATTRGRVMAVQLKPEEPPACDEAVVAIRAADWVILGPGSWFTSVMPHLLVPGVRDALLDTRAKRILTLNLVMHTRETAGLSAANHLEVLAAHAPDLHLDVVLADSDVVEDESLMRRVAETMGAELVLARVSDNAQQGHHDSLRLAAAYRDIIG